MDGTFLEDENLMGSGGLLWGHRGNWVKGFMSHTPGGNPFASEARALRDGMRFAWDHGTRNLLCESDYKGLIDIINSGSWRNHSSNIELLQEVQNLLDLRWQVFLSWVPKENNKDADWMARDSYSGPPVVLTTINSPTPEL
ncbi:uncharacterized protein LOC130736650 [Lotus japonicus]|uniref:uncharacterized protein LOC130736650 n=1 Tax=Lotus japonicus TaxID=34305 RepID=UPI00258FCD59|nr:uncharacterized protein LOC130736650 [Lotus japonicus]